MNGTDDVEKASGTAKSIGISKRCVTVSCLLALAMVKVSCTQFISRQSYVLSLAAGTVSNDQLDREIKAMDDINKKLAALSFGSDPLKGSQSVAAPKPILSFHQAKSSGRSNSDGFSWDADLRSNPLPDSDSKASFASRVQILSELPRPFHIVDVQKKNEIPFVEHPLEEPRTPVLADHPEMTAKTDFSAPESVSMHSELRSNAWAVLMADFIAAGLCALAMARLSPAPPTTILPKGMDAPGELGGVTSAEAPSSSTMGIFQVVRMWAGCLAFLVVLDYLCGYAVPRGFPAPA